MVQFGLFFNPICPDRQFVAVFQRFYSWTVSKYQFDILFHLHAWFHSFTLCISDLCLYLQAAWNDVIACSLDRIFSTCILILNYSFQTIQWSSSCSPGATLYFCGRFIGIDKYATYCTVITRPLSLPCLLPVALDIFRVKRATSVLAVPICFVIRGRVMFGQSSPSSTKSLLQVVRLTFCNNMTSLFWFRLAIGRMFSSIFDWSQSLPRTRQPTMTAMTTLMASECIHNSQFCLSEAWWFVWIINFALCHNGQLVGDFIHLSSQFCVEKKYVYKHQWLHISEFILTERA